MANTVDFVVVCVIDGKVHTAQPGDFTEKQRAAILHIMYHIGEDPPAPVVNANIDHLDVSKVVAMLEGGPVPLYDKIVTGTISRETLGEAAAHTNLPLSPEAVATVSGRAPDGTIEIVDAPVKTAVDKNHEKAAKTQVARQSGYTGDACTMCQSMQVKRNGSCTVCEGCGATTGCS